MERVAEGARTRGFVSLVIPWSAFVASKHSPFLRGLYILAIAYQVVALVIPPRCRRRQRGQKAANEYRARAGRRGSRAKSWSEGSSVGPADSGLNGGTFRSRTVLVTTTPRTPQLRWLCPASVDTVPRQAETLNSRLRKYSAPPVRNRRARRDCATAPLCGAPLGPLPMRSGAANRQSPTTRARGSRTPDLLVRRAEAADGSSCNQLLAVPANSPHSLVNAQSRYGQSDLDAIVHNPSGAEAGHGLHAPARRFLMLSVVGMHATAR